MAGKPNARALAAWVGGAAGGTLKVPSLLIVMLLCGVIGLG